jgi:hypothetical protein
MSISSPAPNRSAPRRRRPAARTLLAVAGAALLLAGCGLFGSDDGAAPTSTTRATTTTSTTTPPVSTSRPPEIIDPGDEPRQALRVTYAEGDEAQITFTSDLQITQQAGGRTQRLDSPPIAQTLTYTVGSVDEDGAQVTVRIDDIAAKGKGTGLTDDQLTALDEELRPMVGAEGTGIVTPLGELEDFRFEAPDGTSDELAAKLDALGEQLPTLGPSLPAEPVGVGASWRTSSTATVGGAEVDTTTTVTVTGIEDGTLSYRATVATSADPQDIALDGLAEGTTARLTASDLQGSTTGSLGLDQVAMTLRTRLSGTQQLQLTGNAGTTDLSQALVLAYVAGPASD